MCVCACAVLACGTALPVCFLLYFLKKKTRCSIDTFTRCFLCLFFTTCCSTLCSVLCLGVMVVCGGDRPECRLLYALSLIRPSCALLFWHVSSHVPFIFFPFLLSSSHSRLTRTCKCPSRSPRQSSSVHLTVCTRRP